jgi:hypothetical protein
MQLDSCQFFFPGSVIGKRWSPKDHSHRGPNSGDDSTNDNHAECNSTCLQCDSNQKDNGTKDETVAASEKPDEPPSNEKISYNVAQVDCACQKAHSALNCWKGELMLATTPALAPLTLNSLINVLSEMMMV